MFQDSLNLLRQAVEEKQIHGFALGAGQGSACLFRGVGGTLGGASPSPAVTERTRYDMDALTQVMVTVPLCLMAVESGRLSLHDPLSRYLDAPTDKRSITLWQLLSHASGMKSAFLLEQTADNAADALRALLQYPLSAPAGKRARHSAMGFALLGKVLEKVYGMPLDAAARKFVFAPLDMKHTGYFPTGEDIASTRSDAMAAEGESHLPQDENARFLHGVSGAAGVFSDLEDCCRFLGQFGPGDGPRLLALPSLALWTACHTPRMKDRYSLGFALPQGGASFLGELWPEGSNGLSSPIGASFALDPASGRYAVLLMNRPQPSQGSQELLRLRRLLHNSVYAALCRAQGEAQA